jgi:GIY-YIG catalytic domain
MWPWTAQTPGTVYIFHFHRPIGNLANPRAQASHYCGFTEDLDARIAEHMAGRGAKIVRAAVAQGITFEIHHWPACLAVEKLIKRRKETSVFCPTCAHAAGRLPRPLPRPIMQLELPLCEDFPAPPATRADWYEISHLRNWRAAHAVGNTDLSRIDDLI